MLRLMRSHAARIAGVILIGLAALAAAGAASRGSRGRAAACAPRLQLIAHGQGSPDDLAWDGHMLLVSDINSGRIGVVAHGKVTTLVRHIADPEGIVPGPRNSLIVAAQGTNSVIEINLTNGTRKTLAKLPLPKGKEGVDGINADGPSAVFVPDSARGRLYVLQLHPRRLSLVATGMVRPVAAINWQGAIVVADEYAGTVWRISHGRTPLAKISLPDDLAVISHHLISSSLLGAVWEAAPRLTELTSAFAPTVTDPQGLVADGPDAVIVAEQDRNAIYRLSQLAGCL
jgi:hypothetical protein